MTTHSSCPECSPNRNGEFARLSLIASEFTALYPMVVITCGNVCGTEDHWVMGVAIKGSKDEPSWFDVIAGTPREDLYAKFYELSGVDPPHNEVWDW